MPSDAKTDDDIGIKPSTLARRAWVLAHLGVTFDNTIDALDLADTSSHRAARDEVPALVNRIRDIMQPLADAPKADLDEVRAALGLAGEIRTALRTGAITLQTMSALRQRLPALEQSVATAVEAVRVADLRRQALISDAGNLAYSPEAEESAEGNLIGVFTEQKTAVSTAFANPPLTLAQIGLAETALSAARRAIEEIASAVELRLGNRRMDLIGAVQKLKPDPDADPEQEKGLIGAFGVQCSAVTGLPEKGLTRKLLDDAETQLKAAGETLVRLGEAVQLRHAAWAKDIARRADLLIKPLAEDGTIDASVWLVPKATREDIDKELVSS